MSKKELSLKKSSSAKLKKTSSHTSSKHRVPRVISPGDGEKLDDIFTSLFRQNCTDFSCEKIPTVSASVIHTNNFEVLPLADITTGYDASGHNLLVMLCKHFNLLKPVMDALRVTVLNFQMITTVKFQFCNLSYDTVAILSQILTDHNCITHVNVDGNVGINESCYLLFEENNVTYLSMRYCSIDCYGMKKISEELSKTDSSSLLHLNLASNMLFDECVPYVANMLKVNRTLQSINLADNKISDIGCEELFLVLQKFKLTQSDVIVRRSRRLEYFSQRLSLMDLYGVKNQLKTSMHSEPKKQPKKPRELPGTKGNFKRTSKSHDSISTHSQEEEVSQVMKQIDKRLGVDPHPFVKDSWEENKEIYCQGNFNLLHMDISYNRITEAGLTSIIEVLNYQNEQRSPTLPGLVKLAIQGNIFAPNCKEIKEIQLLLTRTERRSKGSISLSRDNGSIHSVTKRRNASRKSI